jgi:hypothetical protein
MAEKMQHLAQLLVTSRPNVEAAAYFTKVLRLEVAAHESDIRTYLKSEIEQTGRLRTLIGSDETLKVDVIDKLASRADGM